MQTLMTIKELRQRAGLTQAQLAQKAFVAPSTIAHWEQFKAVPFLTDFRRVCAVLGVPMEKVALSAHERLVTTRNLTYHLQARHNEDGAWVVTVIQADASQLPLLPGHHPSQQGLLPGSLDPNDPDKDSAFVPVGHKWTETAATLDGAFTKMQTRITDALDHAFAPTSAR